MKLAILPLLLGLAGVPLARTAAADAPTTQPGRAVEICFVLDTTGSMGGLIDGAKRKIWSIANDVIARQPKPRSARIAMVDSATAATSSSARCST